MNKLAKMILNTPHRWTCSNCGNKKESDRPPTGKEVEKYITKGCPKCIRKTKQRGTNNG